jgi:probable rRNA maturation factor
MKHNIIIRKDKGIRVFAFFHGFLKKTVREALKLEKINCPCEVNILITGESGIREINRNMRKLDMPTDVLSFPAFDFSPGAFSVKPEMKDPDTGMLPLGDIVISMDAARAQAGLYGHSIKRETAYLTVHSVLHLLGYDHTDEGAQKQKMREREEAVMNRLDLSGKEAPEEKRPGGEI